MFFSSLRPLAVAAALLLTAPMQIAAQANLGSVAHQLAQSAEGGNAVAAVAQARDLGVRVRPNGLIPLILESSSGSSADIDAAAIAALGAQVDATSDSLMRVLVAPGQIRSLSSVAGVSLVRTAAVPREHAVGTGSILSESVNLTGAGILQGGGVDGSGVKVAVVDLGFIGLANAISQGELPANTVSVDFSGTGIEADTSHGTGVAEHVSDMAPGAQIFCIKVDDELDLQNAANYIRNNGIDIANHSVGWVGASYYDDSGPINATINNSHDIDGVLWTVSAGNDATNHWRGTWSDVDGDNRLEFAPGDEGLNTTTAYNTVGVVWLNWNQYGNSQTDLRLNVRNWRGRLIASTDAPQGGSLEPVEALAFTYSFGQAPYQIEIVRNSGPTAGLDMTIFSFYHDLEHASAASSFNDPAAAHGAFTVGAVDQANWNDANPAIEDFSSQGPTNDGRMKPDIVAPDGTSSLTYGVEGAYGTSFSSPTTAGAAALLMEIYPASSETDIANLLRSIAVDTGAPGPDNVFGAGLLDLGAEASPNEAPVALSEEILLPEDTPLAILLQATDADGDALTYSIVTPPSHGSYVGELPALTYEPDLNFDGTDTLTFVANDGREDSNVGTIVIEIIPENDPVSAADLAVLVNEDTATPITLLADDPDGDDLLYSWTDPSHGSLSGAAPNLTYTPNPGYIGPDSFEYFVTDGEFSTSAVVTITVIEAPTGDAVAITRAEYHTKRNRLTVQATSSDNSVVTLIAEWTDAGGGNVAIMDWNSKRGQHELTVSNAAQPVPATVTVTSSGGGEAVSAITLK